MARIIVHKGFISHGGRLYKSGEIVNIADMNYAKRIVARSGGDFDFCSGQEIPAGNSMEEAPTMAVGENPDASGHGNDAGNVPDSDSADAEGLPAINADADMQTSKAAKGKKK